MCALKRAIRGLRRLFSGCLAAAILCADPALCVASERSVNVLHSGARCDGKTDDAAAFARAAREALPKGADSSAAIIIPPGVCFLSAPLLLAPANGAGIAVTGSGADISVLEFAPAVDGISITLGLLSAASVSGLTIRRSAAHQAGNTALAIRETADRSGSVSVRDVVTSSAYYPGSWARGIVLTSTDDAVVDHVHTIAGFPPEQAYGLVIQGLAAHYAVDTSVSNSKFQGGAIGLLVSGFAQGVVATNIFAIAGRIGLSWTDGETNPASVPELLEITNAHFNATEQDLRVHAVSLSLSNSMLWRWPDGVGDSTPWTAIELHHANSSVITGNTVNGGDGGRFTGAESFVRLTDTSAVAISGNTVLTINGPAVRIEGNSTLDQIVGNVLNGVGDGVADSSGRLNEFLDNTVNGQAKSR